MVVVLYPESANARSELYFYFVSVCTLVNYICPKNYVILENADDEKGLMIMFDREIEI